MGGRCSNFCRDFKEFTFRGNLIDLALGIIIGTAFTNVVQSLVNDIITPPLGLIIGGVDFSDLVINMTNFVYKNKPPVVIRYGLFIQQVIYLLIVSLVLFCIIKSVGKIYRLARKKKQKAQVEIELAAPNEELQVLKQIRDLLAAGKASEVLMEPKSPQSIKLVEPTSPPSVKSVEQQSNHSSRLSITEISMVNPSFQNTH